MRKIILIPISVLLLLIILAVVHREVSASASEAARAALKKEFPDFTIEEIRYFPLLDEYELKGFSAVNYAGRRVDIEKLTFKGLKTEVAPKLSGWMGLGSRKIALKQLKIEGLKIDNHDYHIEEATLKGLVRSGEEMPTFKELTLKRVTYGASTFTLKTDGSTFNVEGAYDGYDGYGSFKADIKEQKDGDIAAVLKAELAFESFSLEGEAYLLPARIFAISDIVDITWLELYLYAAPVARLNAEYKDNGFLAEYLADGDRGAAFSRLYSADASDLSESGTILLNINLAESSPTLGDAVNALFREFCSDSWGQGQEFPAVLNGAQGYLSIPYCSVEDWDGYDGGYGDDWDEGEDCERDYYGDCIDEGEDEWNSDSDIPFTHEAEIIHSDM